jgi:hypothetical protein
MGVHDFEQNFHFHPGVIATRDGEWWRLDTVTGNGYVKQLKGKELTLHRGEADPPFGWYSPVYGSKVKSGVLSSRNRGSTADVSLVTAFCMGEPTNENLLMELASRL